VALLAGELAIWPPMDTMAVLLRSAGLAITLGRYSICVEGHSRFIFQQYGGDLSDPVIDADAETLTELLATARLVSEALAHAGVVHRFELYDDARELAGYLHHGWPLPLGEHRHAEPYSWPTRQMKAIDEPRCP
jgi:hypothetical protein